MKKGDKYWTVAKWTSKGARPEQATWTGDMIDNQRKREGRVFGSQVGAGTWLKNNPKWGTLDG